MRAHSLLALTLAALLCAACLDTSPPAPFCDTHKHCPYDWHCGPDSVCVPGLVMVLTPEMQTVEAGQPARVQAQVASSLDQSIRWTAPDGGAVDAFGVFRPGALQGTFRVVATSVADPSVQAAATVTVKPLTLSPASATLYVGKWLELTASVSGSWSVQEPGGGTVSDGGKLATYTAPATAGTYHVVFQLGGVVGKVPVTVVGPVKVTLAPAAPVARLGRTVQFTAAVDNPIGGDTGVTWGVTSTAAASCGAVTAGGLYGAPAAAPPAGTCAVQAVSRFDPQVVARVLPAFVPAPAVTVSPASVSLLPGAAQRFTASVIGDSGPVSWSVPSGGGSIDAAGLFTAPAQPGQSVVRATLQSDPLSTGDAAVTVVASAPAASRSTLSTASSGVHGDGVETFALDAVLRDGAGQPVPGAAIAFDLDPQAPLSFDSRGRWTKGAVAGAEGSGYLGVADASGRFSTAVSLRAPGGQAVTLAAHVCVTPPCDPASGTLSLGLTFLPTAWQPIDAGLTGADATSLADDLASTGVLFLATANGLFKSVDSGATWAESDRGFAATRVLQVVIGPAPGRAVYALTAEAVWGSDDGGVTWNRHALPAGSAPRTLSVDPANPAVLWVSAKTLLRSGDGGATWTAAPIPGFTFQQTVLDPATPGTILAIADGSGTTDFVVYKSTDGGATFAQVFNSAYSISLSSCSFAWAAGSGPVVLDPATHALSALCTSNNVLIRASNGGASWSGYKQSPVGGFLRAGPEGGTVYLATRGGDVWKFTDGSAAFVKVASTPSPLAPGQPTGLGFDGASSPKPLLAMAAAQTVAPGFLRTGADGALAPSNQGLGPPPLDPSLLAADPQAPDSLYLYENGDVRTTSDGGAHWTPLGASGLAHQQGMALAVDAAGARTTGGFGGLWLLEANAVLRLPAGQTQWAPVPALSQAVTALFADPEASGVAYAQLQVTRRLVRTADGGATWAPVTTPLDTTGGTFWSARVGAGSALFGEYGQVVRSLDGGATWAQLPRASPYGRVVQDPNDVNRLVDTYGLELTRDAFVSIADNYPGSFLQAAFDPATPGKLWAVGSPFGAPFGVYSRLAPGNLLTGAPLPATYTNGFASPLFFGSATSTIYFALGESGVWRTTTAGK